MRSDKLTWNIEHSCDENLGMCLVERASHTPGFGFLRLRGCGHRGSCGIGCASEGENRAQATTYVLRKLAVPSLLYAPWFCKSQDRPRLAERIGTVIRDWDPLTYCAAVIWKVTTRMFEGDELRSYSGTRRNV